MSSLSIVIVLGVALVGLNLAWWLWLYKRVERWFFGSWLSRRLGVSIDRQRGFRSHVWRVVAPTPGGQPPRYAQPTVTLLHIFFPVFAAAVSLSTFFGFFWVMSAVQ